MTATAQLSTDVEAQYQIFKFTDYNNNNYEAHVDQIIIITMELYKHVNTILNSNLVLHTTDIQHQNYLLSTLTLEA